MTAPVPLAVERRREERAGNSLTVSWLYNVEPTGDFWTPDSSPVRVCSSGQQGPVHVLGICVSILDDTFLYPLFTSALSFVPLLLCKLLG